jgi:cytidine deaminase
MKTKKLHISFQSFSSLNELSETDQKLVAKAISACSNAYAPFSNFQVGAALLLENKKIVIGSNQENSAYPSGLCAERVALFHAGAQYPGVAIVTLVITARSPQKKLKAVVTPCGACRQVMAESANRQKKPFNVILVGEDGQGYIFGSVYDLLPFSFKFE